MKGIHKGKKCFILATGPSLTIKDVNLLKLRSGGGGGIITLSLNEIATIYDKTDWRPDYYLLIDGKALYSLLKMGYDIWNSIDHSRIIFSHYLKRFQKSLSIPKDVLYFQNYHREKTIKFSNDFFVHAENGFTITFTCIQLAVYMGCTEIYLLGCDCNYNGTNNYIDNFNYDFTKNISQENRDRCAYEWQCAYKVAKEYADTQGLKIYNATRGGKLEIFERVSLEDALKI